MKQKIFFLFFFIFLSTGWGYAQKEMNWWYFGRNTGLNFNQKQTASGTPDMPIPVNGPIYTAEGCFVLSDSNGNFLMASDGSTVYNGPSSSNVMKNGTGLKGHASSTQSGIVVPYPANHNLYYIITVPCGYANPMDGINYSIVDLSVTNEYGRGEVIVKNTNILAGPLKDENLAVTAHDNGRDYWLIHRYLDKIYVWAITSTGVSSPITYPFTPAATGNTGGYTKFSSDGRRIVSTVYSTSRIISADFDPATGIVSDIKINTKVPAANNYSVEFSHSSEWVYIGIWYGNLYKIKYSDLRNNLVPTATSFNVNTLQIGPDKRIYGTKGDTRDLYVIMDPDNGGTDIRQFSNYLTNLSQYGLPTFISSFFVDVVTDPKLPACMNTNITFTLQISGLESYNVTEIEWDFGDGTPATKAPVANDTKTHAYSQPGTYTLTLTPYKADGSVVTTKIKKIQVPISRCVMPVNPNIHIYK